MNERTCIDIFSGLGCFSIAARFNGVRTVAMCEREERCRNFLLANWPGVPVEVEIKTFDATPYRGVWLLAGGPPCQPASLAGKRRGAADDRWLWPQALRIVDEANPTWILFENPPGIDGVGLDGVLAGLEGKGYEVQTLNIPACAVNSPQLRKRLWIVGHAKSEDGGLLLQSRRSRERNIESPRPSQNRIVGGAEIRGLSAIGSTPGSCGHAHQPSADRALANGESIERRPGLREVRPEQNGAEFSNGGGDGALATSNQPRLAQRESQPGNNGSECQTVERSDCAQQLGDLWREYQWIECGDGKYRRAKPGICGLVDGPPVGLLEALGNAIVWPVAANIIAAMIESENQL